MSDDFTLLSERLGYNFNDTNKIRQALVHSSFSNEEGVQSNERLEFLGDAVLHMALTEFIAAEHPDMDEGGLSAVRSYCECEPFLAKLARSIQLGDFIFLGKGEASAGGKEKDSILADTLEAVIAAIYMDGGFKAVYDFVLKHLAYRVREVCKNSERLSPKNDLQELTQKLAAKTPTYNFIALKNTDDGKMFEIEAAVSINGSEYKVVGYGRTKKTAEKNAAEKLIEKLKLQ
jgi:ribonuclease-3